MGIIDNMKLGRRLGLALGVLISFILVLAVLGWQSLVSLNTAVIISGEQGHKSMLAKEIVWAIGETYGDIQGLINEWDVDKKEKIKAKLGTSRESYMAKFDELAKTTRTEQGKKILVSIKESLGQAQEVNSQIVNLSFDGKEAEATALFSKESQEQRTKLEAELEEFLDWRQQQLLSTKQEAESTVARMKLLLASAAALAVSIGAGLGLIVTRSVTKPIATTIEILDHVSQGDLTHEVPAFLYARRDEVGTLATALNRMHSSLSTTIESVNTDISSLATSVDTMSDIGFQLSELSTTAGGKANSVSAAAEEIRRNVESVAAAMEQASVNVNTMAAATEELSTTIGDISAKAKDASVRTDNTSIRAKEAMAKIEVLGREAEEIGSVTETIRSISDKTNLLALNATIEAARAGEAGKGFAVVANEIKELAHQTAEATANISGRLNGMQKATRESVADVDAVNGAIEGVNGVVMAIADAMAQQSLATTEISGNVAQTSQGLGEISTNIHQAAAAVGHVSQEISELSKTVADVANCGNISVQNANAIDRIVSTLANQMGQFTSKSFAPGGFKRAHSQWKRRFRDMLAGQCTLTPQEVIDHHSCAFGQYYFGEGMKRFGHLPAFQEIDSPHKLFHETAREIARLHQEGKTEESLRLSQEFSSMTNHLFTLLDQLEKASKG